MAATYGNGFSRAVPLAYDSATGAFAAEGTVTGLQTPAAIAVSPDSSMVVLAGSGPGADVVAYKAATGARLWSQKLCGFSMCSGADVKVSPDGSTVYVTGEVPWGGPPAPTGPRRSARRPVTSSGGSDTSRASRRPLRSR